MKKILVIGGGPAGMAAGLGLLQSNIVPIILERNDRLGKKLFITGKGRCNVTTADSREEFFSHIRQNPRFLFSAFNEFSNEDLMRLLEENGCPLKVERGNRVFPKSDHSSDIIATFRKLISKAEIHYNTRVTGIRIFENPADEDVNGVVLAEEEGLKKEFPFTDVILATGGVSYPLTGSTGDGHKILSELGIEITRLSPSLVPLSTKEKAFFDLAGLSLKNVTLTLSVNGKKRYSDLGECLFTHSGLGGPLVLTASTYLFEEDFAGGAPEILLDLKPGLTKKQLDERILRDFSTNQNKLWSNIVGLLLPKNLGLKILTAAGVPENRFVRDVTAEERKRFLSLVKELPFHLTSFGKIEEAIVTRGGVAVRELNPKDLSLKKLPAIHVAGELLDIDAVTGGYNLQIAWSTGYHAGRKTGEKYENCH